MVRAYQLNATCYITKPADVGHFVEVVRSIDAFWFMVVTLPAAATPAPTAPIVRCE